jgi:hypothetical protein
MQPPKARETDSERQKGTSRRSLRLQAYSSARTERGPLTVESETTLISSYNIELHHNNFGR